MATRAQNITARYIFAVVSGDGRTPLDLTLSRQVSKAGLVGDSLSATSGSAPILGAEVLPWVGDINWEKAPATRITYTKTATVVERHPFGVRFREAVLDGMVGPYPQRWMAGMGDRRLALNPNLSAKERNDIQNEAIADSVERLERLALLFDTVSGDPNLSLLLYAINEQQFWSVEPLRAQMRRSRGSKTMMGYSLHFRVLEEAAPPRFTLLLSDLREKTPANKLRDALAAWQQILGHVTNAIDTAQAFIDDVMTNYVGVALGFVEALFDVAEAIVSFAEDLADLVVSLAHMPMGFYRRSLTLAGRCVELAKNLRWGLVDSWAYVTGDAGGDGDGDADTDAGSWALLDALEAVDVLEDAVNAAALAVSEAFQAQGQDDLFVSVHEGDTLEAIALRHFGDPERWPEIADLNDLVPPYITDAGAPGTARPGDRLRLPWLRSQVTGHLPLAASDGPRGRRDEDADLFGRDFETRAIFSDLVDLKPAGGSTGAEGLVDVAEVSGIDHLWRCLDLRLRWQRSDNRVFPQTGAPAVIGYLNASARVGAYAVNVAQELRSDDRVVEVRNLNVTTVGPELGFEATIYARDGRYQQVAGGAR